MTHAGRLVTLAILMATFALAPAAVRANPAGIQATDAVPAPPEPPVPQIPSPQVPVTPVNPGLDQQRAQRELALARLRLPEVAGYARSSPEGLALLALARSALTRAEQEFGAGRYYQAAETAAAVVKLTEAIRHLHWAQAR